MERKVLIAEECGYMVVVDAITKKAVFNNLSNVFPELVKVGGEKHVCTVIDYQIKEK